MKEIMKSRFLFRKPLMVFGLFLIVLSWQAGCVDINDAKVQVQPPGQVDQYNRNIVDQCTPHVMPHHLIQASISAAYPNVQPGLGAIISDQPTFDAFWPSITVQLDQNQVTAQNSKPVIDWTQQAVYVYYSPVGSSCDKVKSYGDGMITDCYNVTVQLYAWKQQTDCDNAASSVNSYPVFIYIYPIVGLPVGIQWITPTATASPTATLTSTPTPTLTPTPTSNLNE